MKDAYITLALFGLFVLVMTAMYTLATDPPKITCPEAPYLKDQVPC